MSDLKCPYCSHEFDHDGDFEGMDNNNRLQTYCRNEECEKEFAAYVEFYPSFSDGYKVDCWNGIPCNMVVDKRNSYEDIERYQCEYCSRSELRKTGEKK